MSPIDLGSTFHSPSLSGCRIVCAASLCNDRGCTATAPASSYLPQICSDERPLRLGDEFLFRRLALFVACVDVCVQFLDQCSSYLDIFCCKERRLAVLVLDVDVYVILID